MIDNKDLLVFARLAVNPGLQGLVLQGACDVAKKILYADNDAEIELTDEELNLLVTRARFPHVTVVDCDRPNTYKVRYE